MLTPEQYLKRAASGCDTNYERTSQGWMVSEQVALQALAAMKRDADQERAAAVFSLAASAFELFLVPRLPTTPTASDRPWWKRLLGGSVSK